MSRDWRWFTHGADLYFSSADASDMVDRRCRDYLHLHLGKDPALTGKMDLYITEMVAAAVLEQGFTTTNSPLFPIWKNKAKGTIRPIFDCRRLNLRLNSKRFVLPEIKDLILMTEPGDYLIKIDLTKAYWHLPMEESSRRHLGTLWGGRLYRCDGA